jgi:hypothetical protein
MPDFDVGPGGHQIRRPERTMLSRLPSMLMGAATLPLVLVAMAGAPSCMGFGTPALAAVNACPAATAALGSPISQGWTGISCGNAETEDDDGRASWSFPVAGPNGHGTLDLQGVERSGSWQFRTLVLTAGGRTIDVLGCSAGGTGEMVTITHREVHGTATTIVGEPGVASGDACTVTVDPSDGAQSCRVGVTCGTRTLYGGGTSGYGHCSADASGAVTMRDGNPTSVDSDPMLDLRLGANEVIVTDQGTSGTWVVTITTAP